MNESDRVRSARVEADAEVWLVRLRTTGDASLKPGSLVELPHYLSQGYPEDVYWLTMWTAPSSTSASSTARSSRRAARSASIEPRRTKRGWRASKGA